MTQDAWQTLIARLETDAAFRTAFASATSAQEDVAIAARHGITVTVDDVTMPQRDLSDAELEATSGAGTFACTIYRCYWFPTDADCD